jgi:hypothetical protein
MGMLTPHFDHFYPDRPVDASHPDVLLDFNRCIMCELCVRASRDVDGKNVFALSGRGVKSHLVVNSEIGPPGRYRLCRDRPRCRGLPGGRHPEEAGGVRRAHRLAQATNMTRRRTDQ